MDGQTTVTITNGQAIDAWRRSHLTQTLELASGARASGTVFYGGTTGYPIEPPTFDGFEMADSDLIAAVVAHVHQFVGRARVYAEDEFKVDRRAAQSFDIPSGQHFNIPQMVVVQADGVVIKWEGERLEQ